MPSRCKDWCIQNISCDECVYGPEDPAGYRDHYRRYPLFIYEIPAELREEDSEEFIRQFGLTELKEDLGG